MPDEPTVSVTLPPAPEPVDPPAVVLPDTGASDAIVTINSRLEGIEARLGEIHTAVGTHVNRDELAGYASVDHSHPEYALKSDLDERVPFDADELKIEPPAPEPMPEETQDGILANIDEGHDKRLDFRWF